MCKQKETTMRVRLSTCRGKSDTFKPVSDIPVGAVFEGRVWRDTACPQARTRTRVFVRVYSAVIQISAHGDNAFEFVSTNGFTKGPAHCGALKFSNYEFLGMVEVTD